MGGKVSIDALKKGMPRHLDAGEVRLGDWSDLHDLCRVDTKKVISQALWYKPLILYLGG